MKLLEVGKIVRPHGIKGAVKIMAYIDEFEDLKHVYIGQKLVNANIKQVNSLNNDAYMAFIDVIPNIDVAENFRNQSIYIDRTEYNEFENKIYMTDLIGKDVVDEKGEKIGEMIDYDDYGATIILTIKCGSVSYQLPYVNDIIYYDEQLDKLVTTKQKFEDTKI